MIDGSISVCVKVCPHSGHVTTQRGIAAFPSPQVIEASRAEKDGRPLLFVLSKKQLVKIAVLVLSETAQT
jgi:hypothetical protein